VIGIVVEVIDDREGALGLVLDVLPLEAHGVLEDAQVPSVAIDREDAVVLLPFELLAEDQPVVALPAHIGDVLVLHVRQAEARAGLQVDHRQVDSVVGRHQRREVPAVG